MKLSAVKWIILAACLLSVSAGAYPTKMTIIHFDVNVGDATLILSPDGHAVLVDAGNKGRGLNPIKEFLGRARDDGHLVSLDYTIATHYDADHVAGFRELFENGWYPEIQVYDRGDTLLPRFNPAGLDDPDEVDQLVMMGTSARSCKFMVRCCPR
jgi:beta-lactamase superfamily II metal-dependent hydrolase